MFLLSHKGKCVFFLMAIVALFEPLTCLGADITIKTSRTIDTLSNDTLDVKLRFFAQGKYDTTWQIDTSYDTSRVPLDIVLSIDLSNSMDSANGTAHSRIIWAKVAALGFLDSLKSGDRVAILGWTSTSTGIALTDSSKTSVYYSRWSGFISDFNSARTFIRDSLYLDGSSRTTDTCNGQTLVVRDVISSGTFGNTPMHIAGVMAESRLSALGRTQAKKVVIMLSDGQNNDGVPRSTVVAFFDSLWRTQSLQFNTIGFMQGDTNELHTLAIAGGGYFYNALSPSELDSAYAKLASLLVDKKIDTTYMTTPIQVAPDTVRAPVDVILAIDLSSSMETIESGGYTRLALAKAAALGFLDSLKPQDRISIMGWTSSSGSGDIMLSDTLNPDRYYQKWCGFTSNFATAGSFINDSLFPNDSKYGYTPLRISSILAMKHLSSMTRPDAKKVVIMLSDGENNDGVTRLAAIACLDSLRRTQGLQFHTIGFMDGDTAELHALAIAGGGVFYDAKNNTELQAAYASLAHIMVEQKLAARKLLIQEVVNHPPLNFVDGSQKSTGVATIAVQGFETMQDAAGNTVLRWTFSVIPVWGIAEVSYRVVAAPAIPAVFGVDSAHATGGFWSRMVYTDDQLTVQTMNIPSTGSPPVSITAGKKNALPAAIVSFKREGTVCISAPGVSSPVSLTLFSMNGRIAFSEISRPCPPGRQVIFSIPRTLAAGMYAVRVQWENVIQWKTVRLVR
jgi:Mg-chelatase subunit ChlD